MLPAVYCQLYDEAGDDQLRRAKANKSCSDLMKYFNRPSDAPFDDLTFLDYFERFTVQPKKRTCKRRSDIALMSDSEDSGSDDDSIFRNTTTSTHLTDLCGNYVCARLTLCMPH